MGSNPVIYSMLYIIHKRYVAIYMLVYQELTPLIFFWSKNVFIVVFYIPVYLIEIVSYFFGQIIPIPPPSFHVKS